MVKMRRGQVSWLREQRRALRALTRYVLRGSWLENWEATSKKVSKEIV
jgi:hypothetical protein